MSLTNILTKQKELLRLIAKNHGAIENVSSMHGSIQKKYVCDYIKNQSFFMSEEVTELLLAIGNEDRAVLKPWSIKHKDIVMTTFEPTDKVKSEAIDMLCFCLNICLAAGITPENIEQEYQQVWEKNIKRQLDGY
jgi:NTP pyrophosphatase (non-canonical NTP hydrolase)